MNDLGIIVLRGKRGGFTVVDAEWFQYVNSMKWRLGINGYPRTTVRNDIRPGTRQTVISLHMIVANVAAGVEIDHKNGYKIDNTQRNLRGADQTLNTWNRGKVRSFNGRPPHSRFKGVTWQCGKWAAVITPRRTKLFLGYFANERDAALAYNRAATQHFGEFARLNQI